MNPTKDFSTRNNIAILKYNCIVNQGLIIRKNVNNHSN